MHIHGNPMAAGPAGVHSAASAEKAAAAQRALETRRKLMKSASEIDGELNSEGLFMIGRGSEESSGRHEQPQPRPSRQAEVNQEEQSTPPVSFWA